MIRCQNLSDEDLRQIGCQIAGAFLNEPGVFARLTREQANRMFTLIVRTCYKCGHLYTTSPNREGFCVYWTKDQRPGLWAQLCLALQMAFSLSVKTGLELKKGQNDWTPTEKRYKKHKDFVEIFLLAVRPEYQGQGWMRKIMAEPFELAQKRGTICVLDTDAELKAEKYTHMGMHVVDQRRQRTGSTMYALER